MTEEKDVESEPLTRAQIVWVGAPALAGILLLVLFYALGRTYLGGYEPMLGSFELPEPREALLWLATATFGIPAAIAFAIALARAATLSARTRDALVLFPKTDDRAWIAFASLFALLVPLAIRMLVLDDAPIADDESAYQFGAELVARGHLTTASPPMKLFYDRAFMINDGHLYPMYFMGWPILMAPGVWFGAPGYMNALYSALTVPAIYVAAEELGGRIVARAAVLLFVTSPMFAIAAATQMSNTTCLMALAWMFACWVRSRREGASLGWHAGVGLFFGLAALIRPASALGVGTPILAAWLVDVARGPKSALPRRFLAAAVPGALALALFLFVNKVQNGSYTHLSYDREYEYARENGLRFSIWGMKSMRAKLAAGNQPHFSGRSFADNVGNVGGAVLRLGTATFGWVPSFFFAMFGVRRKRIPELILVLGVFGHCAVHFKVADLGIDMFGTHHYFEIGLAIVLLSAQGIRAVAEWTSDRIAAREGTTPPALLPGALLAGLTFFAVTCTTPPRLRALGAMATDATYARDVLGREGVKRAVVFSPFPFTSRMARCTVGPRHAVFWRPNNDPALANPILWVNHVDVDEDRKLAASFPDRTPLVFFFDQTCMPRFIPLDAPQAAKIPPGYVEGRDWPPGINGPAKRSDE